MAERGLTRDGSPLSVERGLVGRGLEAVGGRLGLPAGAGANLSAASLLAAPFVAGKTALDQYVQARQIDATPFLTPGVAREQKLRNLPLGAGRLYGHAEGVRAALIGDLDARRASAEKLAVDQFRQPRERDIRLRQDAYAADARSGRNEADAMRGLRLDRLDPGWTAPPCGANRSTNSRRSCCRPSRR